MAFSTSDQLKEFLKPKEHKCSVPKCKFKTTEEEENMRHITQHELQEIAKSMDIITKKTLPPKPKKELTRLLEKII